MIETNSDLQSLAATCWAKKRATVEICERLVDANGIVSTFSDANRVYYLVVMTLVNQVEQF